MLTKLRCLLMGHRWVRTSYEGADTSDAFFLRCRRCSKDKDAASGLNGAMGAGF